MNQSLDLIEKVRELRPLIHHITNVITVTDCANITLNCGASPVMASAPEEIADMARLVSALVLNIGTLDAAQVETMIQAGKAANKKGIPIVLDPVGVGAIPFQTQVAKRLLEQLQISYLKENAGEIATRTRIGRYRDCHWRERSNYRWSDVGRGFQWSSPNVYYYRDRLYELPLC